MFPLRLRSICLNILNTVLLITVPTVAGQEVKSENVSVCFNAGDATINFVYNPSSGNKSVRFVSWHRTLNSGGGEQDLANFDGNTNVFNVLSPFVGKINKSGEFGITVNNLESNDGGEYSIILRANTGQRFVSKGMLTVKDPCLEQKKEKDCTKLTCLTAASSPQYYWVGPNKNYTTQMINVCAGEEGNYKCCVGSSCTPDTKVGSGKSDNKDEKNVTDKKQMVTVTGTSDITTDDNDFIVTIVVPIVVVVVVIIVAAGLAIWFFKRKRADKSDYTPTAQADPV